MNRRCALLGLGRQHDGEDQAIRRRSMSSIHQARTPRRKRRKRSQGVGSGTTGAGEMASGEKETREELAAGTVKSLGSTVQAKGPG